MHTMDLTNLSFSIRSDFFCLFVNANLDSYHALVRACPSVRMANHRMFCTRRRHLACNFRHRDTKDPLQDARLDNGEVNIASLTLLNRFMIQCGKN